MKLLSVVVFSVFLGVVFAVEDQPKKKLLIKKRPKNHTDSTLPQTLHHTPTSPLTLLNSSLYSKRSNSTLYSKLRSRLGRLSNVTMTTTPSSHLLIPIPSSQQKPYQPVIVSTQATPTGGHQKDSMITYKLNKMFVPLGIYGRVLNNSEVAMETGKRKLKQYRPADSVSITNEKPDINQVSMTTGRPVALETIKLENRKYTQSVMPPPLPLDTSHVDSHVTGKVGGIFKNLRERVEQVNIPSLIHKGLSNLGQLTKSQWGMTDEGGDFGGAYSTVGKVTKDNVIVSVPGGKLPDYSISASGGGGQALEFFRRRPHLRATKQWRSYLFPPSHAHLAEVFNPKKSGKQFDKLWERITQKYSLQELDLARREAFRVFEGGEGAGLGGVRGRSGGAGLSSAYHDLMGFYERVYKGGEKKVGGEGGVVGEKSAGAQAQSRAQPESSRGAQSWQPVSRPSNHVTFAQKPRNPTEYKPRSTNDLPRDLPRGYSNDEYELIPKETYLKQRKSYELAAVVRPEGISDFEAADDLGQVPVISYGSPSSLRSVQSYLTARNDVIYPKIQESKLLAPYHAPPTTPTPTESALPYQLIHPTPSFTSPPLIDLSPALDSSSSSSLGTVTNFRTSLYRNLLSETLQKPAPPKEHVTKFFAPIPINPLALRQAKSRYGSGTVPKFVVELARKLKQDKDVQGIVRVSRRDGKSGKMVEFLYPVRG